MCWVSTPCLTFPPFIYSPLPLWLPWVASSAKLANVISCHHPAVCLSSPVPFSVRAIYVLTLVLPPPPQSWYSGARVTGLSPSCASELLLSSSPLSSDVACSAASSQPVRVVRAVALCRYWSSLNCHMPNASLYSTVIKALYQLDI